MMEPATKFCVFVIFLQLSLALDYKFREVKCSGPGNSTVVFEKCEIVQDGIAIDLIFDLKQKFEDIKVRS